MSPKLVINPIGGLANRMRALAAGISLAEKLGVDFRVIWYQNWELNARFDDLFQMPDKLDDKFEYPNSLKYGLGYMSPRKRNFYLSNISRKRFGAIIDDTIQDETQVYAIGKDAITNGKDILLQGGTNIYDYSETLYRTLFHATDEIQRRVDSVLLQMGNYAYGLHIRRTDNSESIRHSPDELFVAAIENIIGQEPLAKFYLATDSQTTKERFSTMFGERIVYNSAPAERGTLPGMIDATTELFILSRMKTIFGSYYSSFSEAAAMLGNTKLLQLKK